MYLYCVIDITITTTTIATSATTTATPTINALSSNHDNAWIAVPISIIIIILFIIIIIIFVMFIMQRHKKHRNPHHKFENEIDDVRNSQISYSSDGPIASDESSFTKH